MSLAPTGNISIDALVYSSWHVSQLRTPIHLTYSFMSVVPADADADDAKGFAPMTAEQQGAVRKALALWSAVANIRLDEVAGDGQLQFGSNDQGSTSSGYAYLPEPGIASSYMFVNNQYKQNFNFAQGSFGPAVLLHEIGHMLGLKHPGDYDSNGDSGVAPFLPASLDTCDYTQMSYHDPLARAITGDFAITPMLFDIQAVQYLYGANTATRSGDDVYAFRRDAEPQCIWDAGGNNVLDFSACTGEVSISLKAGDFSETQAGMHNISIAYGVAINTAIAGSAGSTVYANDNGDSLFGGACAVIFFGGLGNDIIHGAQGDDLIVYSGAFASYTVQRDDNGVTISGDGIGSDRVDGVEMLRFSDRTVSVSELVLALRQTGTAGNDLLSNRTGNESIDGGAGIDTLAYQGLRAGFTVAVGGAGTTVTNRASGETDTLANVERLHFADFNVSFEVGGIGGEAYRLYQAAFKRAPDMAGLGFWIGHMDQGLPLQQVAEYFIDSPEFARTYGGVSDTEFVTLLYANALHRLPDADGLAFHVSHLGSGTSRAATLVGFSESPENQAQVIGAIQSGMDYIPFG